MEHELKGKAISSLAVSGAMWSAGSDFFGNDCAGKTIGT